MDWFPLKLSLQVAGIATIVSSAVGIGMAALLTKKRMWGREFVDAIFTLPLVLPPTVLGYYCLVALGRKSAIGQLFESITGSTIVFSFTGCVVAASIGGLPLVVKSARTALEGVPEDLLHAARTLGAAPKRAFFTVRLPLAARGILAGVMLAFAKALGDFGLTLMLAGNIEGQTRTASLAIYSSIMGGHDSEAAAMASVLTAVGIFTLYSVNRLTARKRHG